MDDTKDVDRLVKLIKKRNKIEAEIATILEQPGLIGNIGEFIASKALNVTPSGSRTQKSLDGHFRDGPLAGRSVNVKFYSLQDFIVDIKPDALPEFYLVIVGPTRQKSQAPSRPWVVKSVFLFDAKKLVKQLKVKIGTATYVKQKYWTEAEIFPRQQNKSLVLSKEQIRMLSLFSS